MFGKSKLLFVSTGWSLWLAMVAMAGGALLPLRSWAQPPAPAATTPMDWINHVPESACLAVVAFPEAMLKEHSMELAPRELITLMGKRELGVDFCQLSRVVWVLDAFPAPAQSPPNFAAVLTFSQPQQLNDTILDNFEPTQWNGYSAFVAAGPSPVYLVKLDDNTIGFGTDYLKSVLDKKQTPGALSQRIAAEGLQGQLGVYLDLAALRPFIAENLPPKEQVPFFLRQYFDIPNLVEAITMDFSATTDATNSIRLHTKSARDSQRIWDMLQTGIATAREAVLMQVLNDLDPQDQEMQEAVKSYAGRLGLWVENNLKPEIGPDRLTFHIESPNQFQMVSSTGVLIGMLLPAVQQVREGARRASSANNMRQIMISMHNFHDAYGKLPDRAIRSADGKPLLSWRVAILPFLEEGRLYEQFHLDEPWDSEHNLTLLDRMPAVYQNPNLPSSNETVYLVPFGNGAIYDPMIGRKFHEVTDGLSNTLLLVEANAEMAVPWTKPDDYAFDPADPLAGLGRMRPAGINVGFADAAIQLLPKNIDWETVRSLFRAADNR